MLAAVVAVATAAGDGGPWADAAAQLVGQGPIGTLALAIGWVGWTAWKRERDRADSERARADAERTSRDALAEQFMVRVVPALEQATASQREFVDIVRRWPRT